jgi:hypothetical protein
MRQLLFRWSLVGQSSSLPLMDPKEKMKIAAVMRAKDEIVISQRPLQQCICLVWFGLVWFSDYFSFFEVLRTLSFLMGRIIRKLFLFFWSCFRKADKTTFDH